MRVTALIINKLRLDRDIMICFGQYPSLIRET